jgi:TonB family protein
MQHQKIGWLGGLLLFAALPCSADLYTAAVSYDKGDFAGAFQQYKEMAETGEPRAQYNLAAMYVNGKGVTASNVYAHAWASLSAQSGDAKGAELAAELEPQLTPNSLKLSAEIQAQYSTETLNARLLPRILNNKNYEGHDPVKRVSGPPVHASDYPLEYLNRGIEGHVYVEFTIPPDGHPRLPRILYAIPGPGFDRMVIDNVMHSTYLPARINGVPVTTSTSMFFVFKVGGAVIEQYGDLKDRVAATKAKAEAGDPFSQMLYGMMLAGLPQLNASYDKALPWFLRAAQSGAPYAQYQIGTALLNGHGCQCDNTKGEIWLQKAARADQPDAQVSLAEYLLRGEPTAESTAGALQWLERAAKKNDSAGMLLLAAVLAASPDPHTRDPARALSLADALEREHKNNPLYWEIRAAALAAKGDFTGADKSQTHGIDAAAQLGWNLDDMKTREALYASRQTWTGNLLTL